MKLRKRRNIDPETDCFHFELSRTGADVPVHNVSFLDATSYCEWANVRLPSEAEWLAAAILDERIMRENEYRDFLFGSRGRFEMERFPHALANLGREWVVGGRGRRAAGNGCGSKRADVCAHGRVGNKGLSAPGL